MGPSNGYNPTGVDPMEGVDPIRAGEKPAAPAAPGAESQEGDGKETTCRCGHQCAPSDIDNPDRDGRKYARRRKVYTAIAVVATAGVFAYMAPWTLLTQSADSVTPARGSVVQGAEPAGETLTEPAATSQDQIAVDMANLHQALTSGRDLATVSLPGALSAAAGNTAYVARTIDGMCTVYGVRAGQDIIPAQDTSGAACAGPQIRQVQAKLDKQQRRQQTSSQTVSDSILSKAAAVAARYALSNTLDGKPSFNGISPQLTAPAAIAGNTGVMLTLTSSGPDGTCRQIMVTNLGKTSPPAPCQIG